MSWTCSKVRGVLPATAFRIVQWACLWPALVACEESPSWSVTRNGSILEVAYGSGRSFPQYAALDLGSGYFRMNYGPGSGWGTSVVLVPSLWEGGTLYQGAPIEAAWETRSGDLVIQAQGTIAQLSVALALRLSPPGSDSLSAVVTGSSSGDALLDDRPGEAFKLIMLSSMRISSDLWDTQSAFIDGRTFSIPESGWMVNPPLTGTRFELRGGTSAWKANPPAVEILLDSARPITGWVTPSTDPNDDNVGFWAASEQIVRSWRYTIVVRR